MSHWLKQFLNSQKQTRKFHPIWIVLVAVTTMIVAGVIWIPAAVVPKVEPPAPHPAISTAAHP